MRKEEERCRVQTEEHLHSEEVTERMKISKGIQKKLLEKQTRRSEKFLKDSQPSQSEMKLFCSSKRTFHQEYNLFVLPYHDSHMYVPEGIPGFAFMRHNT
ncbi:unnamed protein product [Auanema sp. JU1783]|nr:unnamed protein product [Auanema sp. JU1783]